MLALTNSGLAQGRILVVEDDGLLAMDLGSILAGWDCRVVGPAGTVATALRLIATAPLDCAILDVHLRGETSEPIAEALRDRGCPFLVLTAYRKAHLPPALRDAPLLGKPVDETRLERELGALLRR